jgi:hypothetical protein
MRAEVFKCIASALHFKGILRDSSSCNAIMNWNAKLAIAQAGAMGFSNGIW